MTTFITQLLTEGESINGLIGSLRRDSAGRITQITLLNNSSEPCHIIIDDLDLARVMDTELEMFFGRHPSAHPGVTIARDVDGAARIGDLAAGECARIAWVFVLRHTPPEPAPLDESSAWRPYPSSAEFTQAAWDAAVNSVPLPPSPEGHGHATRDD